jgi:hypothetical protein
MTRRGSARLGVEPLSGAFTSQAFDRICADAGRMHVQGDAPRSIQDRRPRQCLQRRDPARGSAVALPAD